MPWSDLYKSEKGNLTSLLGTLAQMREGKKNRRTSIFGNLLGIGGQLGGLALQNKWGKEAATLGAQQEETAAQKDFERRQQMALEGRGYETRKSTAEAMAKTRETAALLRGEKGIEQMRINAGAYQHSGEDKDKTLAPDNIVSGEWATYWERLLSNNPKKRLSAQDFDNFRPIAVSIGSKNGFSQPEMEEAVNRLAASYGFQTASAQATPPPPVETSPVPGEKPQGLGGHMQATVRGLESVGKFFAGEGKKAIAGFKKGFGIQGVTAKSVLDSLAKARQILPNQPELAQYEQEALQAGPERLNQIMARIQTLLKPYIR